MLSPSCFLDSEEWLEWMVLPLGLAFCVLTAPHPLCLRTASLQVNDKLGNQTTILLDIPREKSSTNIRCWRKLEAESWTVVFLCGTEDLLCCRWGGQIHIRLVRKCLGPFLWLYSSSGGSASTQNKIPGLTGWWGFGEGGQRSLGLGIAVMKTLNCRWLEKHLCGEMWILDTELDVAWTSNPELC